tara:strand:- start:87 stop:1145 length:1059 start_codon:yes stop_codon:yes gene_type:complete
MSKDSTGDFLDRLLEDEHFKNIVLAEDKEMLEEFRNAHPEAESDIDLAIDIVRSQQFSIEEELEEDFSQIHDQLFSRLKSGQKLKPEQAFRLPWRKSWYLAASVVLVLGLAYWVAFNKIPEKEVIAQNQGQSEQVVKTNPKGIKSVITLSDGSRVTLNSESTISYPRRFHGDKRVVLLEGEAFFEVEKDREHPFVVISGNTSTTALGTSFNIRHYPDEIESYISLATGKVKVEGKAGGRNEGEILLPGEQIVASKDMITFKKKNYDYKEVFLWKEKVIYWNHASWQEISNTLERWYGVSVEVKGLKKEISYSGQFDDQSLENVLVSMGYTLGFSHALDAKKKIVQIEFTNPK